MKKTSIKRHMMDEKIDAMDRISDLPETIMHHILSFLPRKDAAKTSLLSKKWNCVWYLFPIFDFDQTCFLDFDRLPFRNTHRIEEFIKIVDKSLSRFHEHKLQIQKFKLHMTLVDLKWASVVDKWIRLALQHNAKEIDLRIKTIRKTLYTFPGTVLVTNSTSGCKFEQPFYRSAVKLNSLQKLWLKDIYVSEETLQDIFHTYPFISDFALIRCQGLKHLDITTCHNLKILCLSGLSITDQDLHFIISRFPHLETLQVISCNMLKSVKISAQGLRMLTIDNCINLEVDIDAPNLSSFQYRGFCNKFPMIISKNAPCSFQLELIFFKTQLFDTRWFLKLREFLVMSNQRKILSLTFFCLKVTFNFEELRGMTLPSPFELELLSLNVCNRTLSIDYGSLMDGFLWICRPKVISWPTGLEFQEYIMVLCENVLCREDPCNCCVFDHKCWRHHLKGAKIWSLAGIEDGRLLDSQTLLDTLSTLPKGYEIQFRLDWEHQLHGGVA